MKKYLIVLILILLLAIPVIAQETLTNTGSPVYIEPTLSVSKTITKPIIIETPVPEPTPEVTEVITIKPTEAPTEIPVTIVPEITTTQSIADQLVNLVIPTQIPVKIKPVVWKDTSPKISKNKLVFETAVIQQVIVQDADDKNVTISVSTPVNNQIDLPVDISKPGKIAVKMQVGDVVYVIRRNV